MMRTPAAFGTFLVPSLLLLPLVTAGCGDDGASASSGGGGAATTTSTTDSGGGGAGGMTGGTGGAEFVMQPHPAFPTLQGSTADVIPHPKLVTITFQGDPNGPQVQAFDEALVTSDWVKVVGADYGVGDGTHIAKVVMPFPIPSPTDEPYILQQIDEQMTAGLIPKPDDNTIYMITMPAKTVFDDGQGYKMCTDFLGYHWQTDLPNNGGPFTYAFIQDCEIGFDELTVTLAHEYIEAATDPGFGGGFYLAVAKTHPWMSQSGMENADLCDSAKYLQEGGFTYQRVWSNSAAEKAISSPCAPVDPNEVFYDVYAEPQMTLKAAPGLSATYTLTGWSTAPMADWTLDYDAQYYSEFEPQVELSANTINNGKTVEIKLTVPPGTPKGRQGTAMIYSGEGYGRFWPVTVISN